MGNNFLISESFQMIRTNPKLTSNINLVIDSSYKLYLESINTNKILSDKKYKHFSISHLNLLEDKIPEFYNQLPVNISFDIKYDNDDDIMYMDYSNQFDDIYHAGARKTQDNEFYKEEFEYFAPLYIKPNNIPNNFIIMRVDNPVTYELKDNDYRISNINKNNFISEIVNKWKSISVFDLSEKSTIGYWIKNNFVTNNRFPSAPIEIDIKKNNFSKIHGIDYNTGIYTNRSVYLDDMFFKENPHFKLEKFLTECWVNNSLIYPNIINFKFLFDDNPATPFQQKKYTINRYLGFYCNLEYIKNITPYKQYTLRDDIKIEKNIFMLNTQLDGSVMPFSNIDWDNSKSYYIYAKDKLCKVIRIYDKNEYYYKIISEYDLNITDINVYNEIDIQFINSGGTSEYKNMISPRNSEFSIENYIDEYGTNDMYADLYLIKINDNYHVLEKDENLGVIKYYIRSDYGFECDSNTLKSWIINKQNNTTLTSVETYSTPLSFPIYKVKFYDIKDFDFNRVNTHYSDFDFNEKDNYTNTTEHKLYVIEHLDASIPKSFKTYPKGHKYANKTINVSSEYIASNELFELTKNGLTDIWIKNPYIVKFGYMGSNSHSDYPYKFNNNNKVGGRHNKTTNTTFNGNAITEKTHEYFYRIGNFYSGTTSSEVINLYTPKNYLYYDTQTLSIETDTYDINSDKFNLNYYIDTKFDYFDYFFKARKYNKSGIEQTTKYSVLNNGSKYNPSNTIFKGIKYNVKAIKDIIKTTDTDTNFIEKIILDTERNYNNYKLSVIINFNYSSYTNSSFSSYSYFHNDIIDTNNIVNVDKNCIYVFINNFYKNILILLNIKTNMINNYYNFNNLDKFDERDIIYFGWDKNQKINFYDNKLISSINYFNAFNNNNDRTGFDDYINYIYIDENGNTGITNIIDNTSSIINTSWNKHYPPALITLESPDILELKRNSYNIAAIKGPKYNIYDKYKTDYNEVPYDKSDIKEPLSTYIKENEEPIKYRNQEFAEEQVYKKIIYRYSGAYEPIFQDIELFKNSKYFYTIDAIFQKTKNPNNAFNFDNVGSVWNLTNRVFYSDGFSTECDIVSGLITFYTGYTNTLSLDSFFYDLPKKAILTGIELNILRKSEQFRPESHYNYNYIIDNKIKLKINNVEIGQNYANSEFWGITFSSITYGGKNDLWGLNASSLTYDVVNLSNFGINIQAKAIIKQPISGNKASIDSVNLILHYIIDGIITGQTYFYTFDRNYKFDTELNNFGIIEEMIYSKINEKENVLKIKNTEEDRSIYPMIDEYGYSYNDRFIFKSSWDNDFYTRTKNEIE
jgi:hypothetical protein